MSGPPGVTAMQAASDDTAPALALEAAMDAIISDACLRPSRNAFFRAARAVATVDAPSGLHIAHNWREITKTFMLSTIVGLGEIARAELSARDPAFNALGVLQTGVRVIADDLDNAAPAFAARAPGVIDGVHYLWWQASILQRIAARCPADVLLHCHASPPTVALTGFMRDVATSPLGAAVQLRVVETIARDIAIAFRRVFSRLEIGGEKLFAGRDDLAWIDTHIQAEVIHARDVCDGETGMASLAVSEPERQRLLALTRHYAHLWNEVLEDFAAVLIDAHETAR